MYIIPKLNLVRTTTQRTAGDKSEIDIGHLLRTILFHPYSWVKETFMSFKDIPVIEIKGDPRQRGRQQGEGARKQIQAMLNAYQEFPVPEKGKTWSDAIIESQKYLVPSEKAFPDYIEELLGISEGANIAFEDVWLLNSFEEVFSDYQIESCSNIAVSGDHTANGRVLLAHNEDWISVDRDHIYLVKANLLDQPSYMGITYGPLLVNIGLNEDGLGTAINSVYHTDLNYKVPRIVFSRAVLAARTIGEAMASCLFKNRAGGYNHTLADPNGELYCVESSANKHDILYEEEGWLVHTNHYLSSTMKQLEKPGNHIGSHIRLNRLRRLIKRHLGKISPEILQAILKDHVNYPNSICSHEVLSDKPLERTQTIASLVMDLTERQMWVSPGTPCRSDYKMYQL